MTTKKKAPVRSHRHAFRFKLENGEIITQWAKVRPATAGVELTLRAEHVRKSLSLGGQGNTQKCAMAVCSQEHGDAFPHPFSFVDWLDTRAYFVTKTQNGLPSECVVYRHADNIAPNFDTEAGTKKLLKYLEKHGEKKVTLYPGTRRKKQSAGKPTGAKTGARKRTISVKKGAARRFARLQLGGAPA